MQRAFGTGAIMIRLNGPLAATFAARIDEIERAQTMREFHRMQAAFAEVLHLLGQLLPWSPAPSLRTLTHGIAAMVARRTATRPVRNEVLHVRNAIQCDLTHRGSSRRWPRRHIYRCGNYSECSPSRWACPRSLSWDCYAPRRWPECFVTPR